MSLIKNVTTYLDGTMISIPEDELSLIEDLKNCRVLELGNKHNSSGPYRNWYVERGCKYTSIDWNGRNGAIVWDMRNDLDVRRDLNEEPFDVVTNFGFSEHVTVQKPVWESIHNAVRIGGMMVHCLPTPFEGQENARYNWEKHGYWHPTKNWMNKFCEANQYTIEYIKEYHHNRKKPTLVARLFKSVDTKFVWVDGLYRTTLKFTKQDLQGK